MKKANGSKKQKRRFEDAAAEALNKTFRILYSLTHDADLAAELAQEAACRFVAYMNRRGWSADIKSFDAFLIRTALNCLKSRWRAEGKVQFVSLDSDFTEKFEEEINKALGLNEGSIGADDDRKDLEKLHHEVLLQLLDGLTEYDEYLLRLRRVEDLSWDEIAEITGKDVYWVRYQVTRIEARIRARAKQYLKASGKKNFF